MMSVSAIGAISPQATPYPARPAEEKSGKPEQAKELTVVTTHCDKQHKHTRSCPHTVSTMPDPTAAARPVPKDGERGSRLDERA